MIPLQDLDPNVVRHNSISSHTSSKTAKDASRTVQATTEPAPPSVLSMLRTGTETGDLGAFSMNSGRFPKLPNDLKRKPSHRLGKAAPSRTSSQYSRHNSLQDSVKSGRSQRSGQSARSGRERTVPGEWPFAQYPFVAGQEGPPSHSDARSSGAQESVRSLPMTPHDLVEPSHRSQSLTQAVYPHANLKMHRSVASLHSQPETGPRSRTPQAQLSRFPPSAFRSASPALSDTVGNAHIRRTPTRPVPGPRSYTTSPVQQHQGMRAYPSPGMPLAPRPSRTIEELRRPFLNGQHLRGFQSFDEYQLPPRAVRQPIYPGDRLGDQGPSGFVQPGYNLSSHAQFPQRPTPPKPSSPNHAPFAGFVQRVRNALEERSVVDQPAASLNSGHLMHEESNAYPVLDSPSADNTGSLLATPTVEHTEEQSELDLPVLGVNHEEHNVNSLEQGIEQGEAQVPETPTVKRLTRDLIKAGTDAKSDVVATSEAAEEGQPESIKCDVDSTLSRSIRNSLSSGDPDSPDNTQRGIQNELTETQDAVHISHETPNIRERSAPGSFLFDSEKQSPPSPSSPSSPWMKSQRVLESAKEKSGGVNRRTFPCGSETVNPLSRPFSMPPEKSRSLSSSSKHEEPDAYHMSGTFKDLRPASPAEDAVENELDRVTDIDDLQRIAQPSSELFDEERDTVRYNSMPKFEGPTRVTILPSSSTTSVNLSDEQTTSHRRGPSSSLGTVPESDQEPSTSSNSTSEVLNITSLRNSVSSETTRRSSGANDLAPSAMKNFHFPLPDLTEDSQEDPSTTNLRMLGNKPPMFRGRGGFKEIRRHARAQPKHHPPTEPLKSYFGRELKDSHNLPSFNFSRTDLTTKLNAALGFRNSRSLEELPKASLDILDVAAAPARPVSSKSVRLERYRSFFMLENSSSEEMLPDPPPPSATKSLGPDDKLLHEIEQLSIPSVKNLSLRLSELFPSIRSNHIALDLDRVDAALSRSVREARSSGSHRHVASVDGVADESGDGMASSPLTRKGTVTSDGSRGLNVSTRDQRCLRLNKELPPLPPHIVIEDDSEESDGDGYESARASQETTDEAQSGLDDTDHKKSMERPSGGKPEAKADAKKPQLRKMASRLSLRGSAETAPPLKSDEEGYTWSEGTRTADLTLTSNAGDATMSTDTIPKRGRSRSSPPAKNDNTLRVIRSMSPGFDANLVPNSEVQRSSQSDGSAKPDVLRSPSRKKGKAPLVGHSEAAIDPRFFHPEEETHHRRSAVAAGDRYPTSALAAPPGLSIDESRSYFSDDSEEDARRAGQKRRRFTRLKNKRSMPGAESPNLSPIDSGSDIRRTPNQESMVFVDAPPGPMEDAHHEKPPAGMSKAEFHAKRFVEKLRFLLFRGGEALRNIGVGRQRRRQVGGGAGGEGGTG